MDAVKFLEESRWMCQKYHECIGCPAYCFTDGCEFPNCAVSVVQYTDASDAVAIVEKWAKDVEKWAKEHPRKTRMPEEEQPSFEEELLKLFGGE